MARHRGERHIRPSEGANGAFIQQRQRLAGMIHNLTIAEQLIRPTDSAIGRYGGAR
jgi:hypothetical protein